MRTELAKESDEDEYDDDEDRARKSKAKAERAKEREERLNGVLTIEDDELSVFLRQLPFFLLPSKN